MYCVEGNVKKSREDRFSSKQRGTLNSSRKAKNKKDRPYMTGRVNAVLGC
jgi:hypothetical protein